MPKSAKKAAKSTLNILTGSPSLAKLIKEGAGIARIGTLVKVPFKSLIVDKHALCDNTSTRQRVIHANSVTKESIRERGWCYDQGTMLAIEVPWDEATWAQEVAKGVIPVGTEMPTPLRRMVWPPSESGLPSIEQTPQPSNTSHA